MDKLFGIDISHWQGDLSIKQARDERGRTVRHRQSSRSRCG